MPEENTFKTGEYSALDGIPCWLDHLALIHFFDVCQLEHPLLQF